MSVERDRPRPEVRDAAPDRAERATPPPLAATVLMLQRTAGNRAVGRLVSAGPSRHLARDVDASGDIGDRGADPFIPLEEAIGVKKMTRHHIIPVKVLTEFFNAVKANKHLERAEDGGTSFGGFLGQVAAKGFGGEFAYAATDPGRRRTKERELRDAVEYVLTNNKVSEGRTQLDDLLETWQSFKKRGERRLEVDNTREWQDALRRALAVRGIPKLTSDEQAWARYLLHGHKHAMGELQGWEAPTLQSHAGLMPGRLATAGERPLSDAERLLMNQIAAMYHWMPGNLFEGLSDREDDPKDGLDIGAEVILDGGFDRYRETHDAMVAYVGGEHEQLAAAMRGLVEIAKRSHPYPYKPSQWDTSGTRPKVKR